MTRPQIALCYFGIPRCLEHTHASLHTHILQSAQQVGDVDLYVHFYNQTKLDNVRSNEFGTINNPRLEKLYATHLNIEEDKPVFMTNFLDIFKNAVDRYENEHSSTTNITRQLCSIYQVTNMVQAAGKNYDAVIYIRPDIIWETPIQPWIEHALNTRNKSLFVPNWQGHLGVNDRMAICTSPQAVKAWGKRLDDARGYLDRFKGLNAEELLHFVLKKNRIAFEKIAYKGHRIRHDGTTVHEDYTADSIIAKQNRKNKHRYIFNETLKRIRNVFISIGIPENYLSIRKKIYHKTPPKDKDIS